MILSKLKKRKATAAATREARELTHSGRYAEAVEILTKLNNESRDTATEIEIRRLRHLAGIDMVENAPRAPIYTEATADLPPIGRQSKLPELTPAELTPAILRGSIMNHGALMIRGLMGQDKARQAARDIERAYAVRAEVGQGGSDTDGYYNELVPEPAYAMARGERGWVSTGGGLLAVDSPRLLADMIGSFVEAGLRELISSYLGEPAALSAQKCTLRKATPEIGGSWHQDGKFLGDVRSLNLWLTLSECGENAPSLDIIPARQNQLVTAGTDGVAFDIEVSPRIAEEVAGDAGIVRPIFEPGDALIFDDLFLHQTGSDPAMPDTRYSIESWFFGASAFPGNYIPIAF